jgi:hypothetical protein
VDLIQAGVAVFQRWAATAPPSTSRSLPVMNEESGPGEQPHSERNRTPHMELSTRVGIV